VELLDLEIRIITMQSTKALLSRLYSFKLIICVALLWLTVLAAGLTIYSTQIYRELAIENQNDSLRLILEARGRQMIESLQEHQYHFAAELQLKNLFQQVLNNPDEKRLKSWLSENFENLTVDNDEFRLKSIIIRSLDGEIIAEASDKKLPVYSGCIVLINAIGKAGLNQQVLKKALCSHEDNLFSEILVPIDILNS